MTPELRIVIVASGSGAALLLVIILLAVVISRNGPFCCRITRSQEDDVPGYHSRPSRIRDSRLIGRLIRDSRHGHIDRRAIGPELPAALFIVGKPRDYHMDAPPPRLPSYETVQRADRQIQSRIAQRFGLAGCNDEPPPTYEDTFRRSLEVFPADLHQWADVPPPVSAGTPPYSEDLRPPREASGLQEPASPPPQRRYLSV